jgi:hypothetical protein
VTPWGRLVWLVLYGMLAVVEMLAGWGKSWVEKKIKGEENDEDDDE